MGPNVIAESSRKHVTSKLSTVFNGQSDHAATKRISQLTSHYAKVVVEDS